VRRCSRPRRCGKTAGLRVLSRPAQVRRRSPPRPRTVLPRRRCGARRAAWPSISSRKLSHGRAR
jgi:hypothetical protein